MERGELKKKEREKGELFKDVDPVRVLKKKGEEALPLREEGRFFCKGIEEGVAKEERWLVVRQELAAQKLGAKKERTKRIRVEERTRSERPDRQPYRCLGYRGYREGSTNLGSGRKNL